MKRNMLILSAGLVIVALLSVSFAAVMAEPVSKTAGTQAQDIKKILGIVKSTQAHVVVVENQVSAPHPSPIRYEYYTAVMGAPNFDTDICVMADLLNTGESVAEVHWELYLKDGTDDWTMHTSKDETIDPGTRKGCYPSVVGDFSYQFYYKFSTNSKFVVPTATLSNATSGEHLGERIDHYHPGDFHRVEIYDEWS
jgi:hypothetical protein